jgi:hypothetical protein
MSQYNTLSLIPVIALHRMCSQWTGPVPVLFVPFVTLARRPIRHLSVARWRIPQRAASNISRRSNRKENP